LTVSASALALCLAGCAGGGSLYPSTANIDRVTTKTLSPTEQRAVIDDLQSSGAQGQPKEPTPLITTTTEE